MHRTPRPLLAAAALACSLLVHASSAMAADVTPVPTCSPIPYPATPLQDGQSGIVALGFLIRADGTVAETRVIASTGVRDLDRAAMTGLSKCRWRPIVRNGQPIDAWQFVAYTFALQDDPDLALPKREAALAAKNGDIGAYYRLSLLLAKTAKTDEGRKRALVVLRTAAERGHAHAQYELGRRLEQGDGVDANAVEAGQWYEKAAAQGSEFARQRLRLGE